MYIYEFCCDDIIFHLFALLKAIGAFSSLIHLFSIYILLYTSQFLIQVFRQIYIKFCVFLVCLLFKYSQVFK